MILSDSKLNISLGGHCQFVTNKHGTSNNTKNYSVSSIGKIRVENNVFFFSKNTVSFYRSGEILVYNDSKKAIKNVLKNTVKEII